jgi:integrase/recombinase XerC
MRVLARRSRIGAWLGERGPRTRPLWAGRRGRLTDSGITQVVLAVGDDAGITGLRPHLSAVPSPPASVKAAPTHPSPGLARSLVLDTSARYFRAGPAETAVPATMIGR